ncbi:hypothetical protein [Aurantimonas sp. Leaf443]|uniref:hypothetical protein n=1 Tax=Aurantimonas sp. Leaf443 TaxID=1736378 RepID=UPI0012E39C79|nr:hypothetical protein [Aurantimonas sp. Leaf443]
MPKAQPSADDVAKCISDIVHRTWAESQQPVLLAALPPLIERVVGDYDEALGGRGLFQFTQEALADDVVAVRHPVHIAKVGLIPKGKAYQFPTDGSGPTRGPSFTRLLRESARGKAGEKTKLDTLMEVLSDLDEEDAKQVSIPFHIILKLSR